MIFIVVVGVGVAGILSVMNVTTRASADPMARKQAMAIAESLLEEIELHPFTFCDPDDPAAPTANGVADCATPEGFGAEPGEGRGSPTAAFDNVNDYGGAGSGVENMLLPSPPGIRDITGTAVAGLSGYSASVTITGEALGAVPAAESLRIDVRVRGPGGADITLTGYRLRYAPNAT